MSGIFISYRRDDARHWAKSIYERLAIEFPPEQIFIDTYAISPGSDFEQEIAVRVSAADVLLAIIGPAWSSTRDARGQTRISMHADFVRLEIAAAMNNQRLVIPILVGGATLPRQNELPSSLSELSRIQAIKLDEHNFAVETAALVEHLKRIVAPPTKKKKVGMWKKTHARPGLAEITAELKKNPPKRLAVTAAIFSVGWLAVCILTYLWSASNHASGAGVAFSGLGQVSLPVLGMIVAIPIVLAWLLAAICFRVQEARLLATSMSEIMLRMNDARRLKEMRAIEYDSMRNNLEAIHKNSMRVIEDAAAEKETLLESMQADVSEKQKSLSVLREQLQQEAGEALRSLKDQVAEKQRNIATQVEAMNEIIKNIRNASKS